MDEQREAAPRNGIDELAQLRIDISDLKKENQRLLLLLSDMKYAFALSELRNYAEKESLMVQNKQSVAHSKPHETIGSTEDPEEVIEVDDLSSINEKEPLNHLIHRLEIEGMEKVQTLLNRDLQIDSLIKIMEDGEKFKNKPRHILMRKYIHHIKDIS